MNIAVIFAGGIGQRMNSRAKPKQFLLVHGKPIIIYTRLRRSISIPTSTPSSSYA